MWIIWYLLFKRNDCKYANGQRAFCLNRNQLFCMRQTDRSLCILDGMGGTHKRERPTEWSEHGAHHIVMQKFHCERLVKMQRTKKREEKTGIWWKSKALNENWIKNLVWSNIWSRVIFLVFSTFVHSSVRWFEKLKECFKRLCFYTVPA